MDRRASRSLVRLLPRLEAEFAATASPAAWTIFTAVAFSRGFSPRPYHANQELLTHYSGLQSD